jgi:hypothetical protein
LLLRVVSVFLIDEELTATSFENLIELHAVEPVLRIQDFIPDPDCYLGSNNSNKRGGGKIFVVLPFFEATNFTKF